MNSGSARALTALAESLPNSDALNLGYALLVEGELSAATMQAALDRTLSADPLFDSQWDWKHGDTEDEIFAEVAAKHLSTPVPHTRPFSAALWSSCSNRHLLLLAVNHRFADGAVLDRVCTDLSAVLDGRAVGPVSFGPEAIVPFVGRRNVSVSPNCEEPTVRARCDRRLLAPQLISRFMEVTRGWRATPFAGAVACSVASFAACTGRDEVTVSFQVAGRNSSAALRMAGPRYDYTNVTLRPARHEPLTALLRQASECLVRGLSNGGAWATGQSEDPPADLVVVFDRHPLSGLVIPGCRVSPLSVDRHPQHPTGLREYLVYTEPDVIVCFRELRGAIGVSLFTKVARVGEAIASQLFDTLLDAIHTVSNGGRESLGPSELVHAEAETTIPPSWPVPTLSDAPFVDAVSPVFRLRADTLEAFSRDTCSTLDYWGVPPWQREA